MMIKTIGKPEKFILLAFGFLMSYILSNFIGMVIFIFGLLTAKALEV